MNEWKEGIDCIFIGPPNNGTGGGMCSSGAQLMMMEGHQEARVCGREIRYWELDRRCGKDNSCVDCIIFSCNRCPSEGGRDEHEEQKTTAVDTVKIKRRG